MKQAEAETSEAWVLYNPYRTDLPLLKGWSEIARRLGGSSSFISSMNGILDNPALVTTLLQTVVYGIVLYKSISTFYQWGSLPKETSFISLDPLVRSNILDSNNKTKSLRLQAEIYKDVFPTPTPTSKEKKK